MLICYFLLALLVLFSLNYVRNNFNDNYLSYEMTNTIKGIFILLVFIHHIIPYIIDAGWLPDGFLGEVFWFIKGNVGQWIVAMFLFYSGYGVMESIKRKGNEYIHGLPKKRIFQVLINFDIAVFIFIVVDLILKRPLTIKQCLLSLLGWESVGNSNWYIFVIMLMYMITFVAFYRWKEEDFKRPLLLLLILTVISSLVLSYLKEEYWYNTMFCYTVGVLFSMYKNKIESFMKSRYWLTLIIALIVLLIIDRIPYSARGLVYNTFSVVFCFVVILLTMKFKINSKILLWCGQNLFPLYIYQRIAMVVLSSIHNGAFAAGYPFLFTAVCFIITIVIAKLYKYIAVKF